MATPKLIFEEGERVLCFCGPLIYEAKCLEIRASEKASGNEYLVHYQGWNRNWDEWVPESSMLKYNEENLLKQLDRKKSQTEKKSKKGKGKKTGKDQKSADTKSEGSVKDPDSRPSTPNVDNKGRIKDTRSKIKSTKEIQGNTTVEVKEEDVTTVKIESNPVELCDSTAIVEEKNDSKRVSTDESLIVPEKRVRRSLRVSNISFTKVPFISNPNNGHITIPPALEKWLEEEYDQILRLNKLVNLPAAINVSELLLQYHNEKSMKSPENSEALLETTTSLDKLFCCCLGSFLLYKWERPQYADILEKKPGVKMSEVYGPHHFLRLLVKISDIVSSLPAEDVTSLVKIAEDLLNFLTEKEKCFFHISNFGISTPDYHRRAI